MAEINFTGLASGMDTESIISKLMLIERQPLTKLQQKSSLFTAKKTVLQDINTKLLTFYNASRALVSALEDVWNQKTSTVSDSSLLGVTATADAGAGTYSVEITKLAQAHTVASNQQTGSTSPLFLSGKFYINGKEVSVTYTDSLQSIKNKINNTSDINVTASIVDNVLRIKSNNTGSTQITLSDEITPTTTTTNSSNPAVLTATVTGTPTFGDYDFVVSQLAQQHEVASDAAADPSAALGQAGTFEINGQAVNVIVADSLNDIRDKINAAGAGVTASVNGSNQLVIKSDTSGASGTIVSSDTIGTVLQNLGVLNPDTTYKNVIAAAQDADFTVDGTSYTRSANVFSDVITDVEITLTGTGSSTLTVYNQDAVLRSLGVLDAGGGIARELVAAQDAQFKIDGQTIIRSTNTVSDALTGVTLTLKGETTSPLTMTVSADDDSIISEIKEWVDAYNAAYKLVKDKLTESTVSNPKTETERNKGLLRNDTQLMRIRLDIRQLLANSVESQPTDTQLLSQIGIETNSEGQLTIDEDKLQSALEADPGKVEALFTAGYGQSYNEATAGFATRIEKYLKNITKSYTGEFAQRAETIDDQLWELSRRIEKWEIQLTKTEDKFKKQFREMEKIMQFMQAQSSWLTALQQSFKQSTKSEGTGLFGLVSK